MRGRPIVASDESDAGFTHRRDQLVVEHPILFRHERVRFFGDRAKHVAGAQIVGTRRGRVDGEAVLQTRHANLEELVEIRRRDAKELEPLEQRHARVHRLLQHAQIERELRQLAVDVVVRKFEIQRVHRGRRNCFRIVNSAEFDYTLRPTGRPGRSSHRSVRDDLRRVGRRCRRLCLHGFRGGGRRLRVAVELAP